MDELPVATAAGSAEKLSIVGTSATMIVTVSCLEPTALVAVRV